MHKGRFSVGMLLIGKVLYQQRICIYITFKSWKISLPIICSCLVNLKSYRNPFLKVFAVAINSKHIAKLSERIYHSAGVANEFCLVLVLPPRVQCQPKLLMNRILFVILLYFRLYCVSENLPSNSTNLQERFISYVCIFIYVDVQWFIFQIFQPCNVKDVSWMYPPSSGILPA